MFLASFISVSEIIFQTHYGTKMRHQKSDPDFWCRSTCRPMVPNICTTVYSSDTKAYRERTKRLSVSPYLGLLLYFVSRHHFDSAETAHSCSRSATLLRQLRAFSCILWPLIGTVSVQPTSRDSGPMSGDRM